MKLISVLIFLTIFQYEDDEGDKVLLATDSDLISAVTHARSIGLKVLFFSVTKWFVI